MMEFTGERFVPALSGQIKYEHLHRYALSMEFAVDKSVLDIASGEGYGAALMAQVAERVTGVDIDEETVAYSQHKYYYPNLNFLAGSCQSVPLADASVDLVTSFETIEHHDAHEQMMREIKRVLKPGGTLIISSPNRLTYSDEPHYSNPFHVKELYFDEFHSLLKQHFKNIKIYGQRLATASFVYDLKNSSYAKNFKAFAGGADGLRRQVGALPSPIYFVAVCSDAALDERSGVDSVYLDGEDDLLRTSETERNSLLKSLDEQTRQRDEHVLGKERELQAKQEELIETLRLLRDREQELREHQQLVKAKDRQLEERRLEFEDCRQMLKAAQQQLQECEQEQQQLSSRLSKVNERQLDEMRGRLKDYQEQLRASAQQLGEARRELSAQEQRLREKEQALELCNLKVEEYSSRLEEREDGRAAGKSLVRVVAPPAPATLDEATLLSEIRREVGERNLYLRSRDLQLEEMKRLKDLQLEEMKRLKDSQLEEMERSKDLQIEELRERLSAYEQTVENFGQSGSYRLGRALTAPLRMLKRLVE